MTWGIALQIILIILTILGWLAAFWFGVKQNRENLKDNSKMRVYEEFWRQRTVLQKSSINLIVLVQQGPPFILMKSTKILGEQTKDPKHIFDGQQQALNYINSYIQEITSSKENFGNDFLDFWRTVEMWLHVMPGLETAMNTLVSEYTVILEKINKYISHLSGLNRYEWEKWDKKNLEERWLSIWEDLNNLSFYIEDFMGLIHNELVTPMFKYEKPTRKPSDYRYKVLTKNGLVVVKNK